LANFESGLDGLVPAQVANGCHSVDFPTDRANLLVVERRNACFDFGAWGAGLRAADAARRPRDDPGAFQRCDDVEQAWS